MIKRNVYREGSWMHHSLTYSTQYNSIVLKCIEYIEASLLLSISWIISIEWYNIERPRKLIKIIKLLKNLNTRLRGSTQCAEHMLWEAWFLSMPLPGSLRTPRSDLWVQLSVSLIANQTKQSKPKQNKTKPPIVKKKKLGPEKCKVNKRLNIGIWVYQEDPHFDFSTSRLFITNNYKKNKNVTGDIN